MSKEFIFALIASAVVGLFAAVVGLSLVGCGGIASTDAKSDFSRDSLTLAEGKTLYEEGKYDLARGRLMVSVGSKDGSVRAESSLYLNALEMELGHWDAARPWLERYHAEMTALSVDRAVARLDGRYRRIMAGIVGVIALLGGVGLWLRRRSLGRRGRPSTLKRFAAGEMERFMAEAEGFKRTPIHAEIEALAQQKERGRASQVLSFTRQSALDDELARSFADFVRHLRTDHPALTEGDVKMCCLTLAGLSSFGRAVCFGSTETNIVKQRKHKIKQKLTTTPGGRHLFDFVFNASDTLA